MTEQKQGRPYQTDPYEQSDIVNTVSLVPANVGVAPNGKNSTGYILE